MKWLVSFAFAVLLATMVTTTIGSKYFHNRAAPSARITVPAPGPPPTRTTTASPGTTTSPAPSGVDATPSATSSPAYTLSQIAGHASSTNCWLIIDRKVFDVTSYLDKHPGGARTITPWCGKESTDAFATEDGRGEHSPEAFTALADYYIGLLSQ